MEFVIVTGLSGAGRSQTVKVLEDSGYYSIDNLPPSLLPQFADLIIQSKGDIDKVAFAIDIRGGEFFDDLFDNLDEIKRKGHSYKILFLDASDQVIVKRYKEQRRPHPLCEGGRVINGIEMERVKLSYIKTRADHIIDTSNYTLSMLKETIRDIVTGEGEKQRINISVLSFGFKHGIPLDADLVFDVRFLPNPYYIEELKPLSGNDQEIRDYVMQWEEAKVLKKMLSEMISFLIPQYEKEGKVQLIVAIGCTGGRHRSVTIANELYDTLKSEQYRVVINHRDCYRK
ncbi:MAG: RNase adapter RapZ [Tissierellales bacterium]|jgi:UPF0042 nucleotide-binding protein|nr:RNase adapter RapZ [Tissierellales bacterium]